MSITCYKINEERLEKIARLANVTVQVANHALINYDGKDSSQHQRWLDTASDSSIASWVWQKTRDLVIGD